MGTETRRGNGLDLHGHKRRGSGGGQRRCGLHRRLGEHGSRGRGCKTARDLHAVPGEREAVREGKEGRDLHALSAGASWRRSDGRRDRLRAFGGLPRGGEPFARAEGNHVVADERCGQGRTGVRVRRRARTGAGAVGRWYRKENPHPKRSRVEGWGTFCGLIITDLMKTALIAVGGNSLIRAGEKGTVAEQLANARRTSAAIVGLIRSGYHLVITHGNGPQVGAQLLRSERASDQVPAQPLDVCGAASQGEIGYLLCQALNDELEMGGLHTPVVSVVTQTVVSREDPAMKNPTKPIGPFYSRKDAEERRRTLGWQIVEDAARG